jgi:hypothetical protein
VARVLLAAAFDFVLFHAELALGFCFVPRDAIFVRHSHCSPWVLRDLYQGTPSGVP